MNAKEKWITEVENSLSGLKPADVNPYLHSKIIDRLNARNEVAPSKIVWASVASFIVILTLNIFVLTTSNFNKPQNYSELQIVAKQYKIINDNTINYN